MIRRLFFLCILFFSATGSAQDSLHVRKFFGKVKERDTAGNVLVEGWVWAHHRTGEWWYYNTKGDITAYGHYSRGLRHGYWWDGFPDGGTRFMRVYKRGTLVRQIERDKDGERRSENEYDTHGQLFSRKTYFPGGFPDSVLQYVNGKLNGSCSGYYNMLTKSRPLHWKATFKEGKPDGLYQEFYYNGKPLLNVPYKDGLPEGELKRYAPDIDTPIVRIAYHQGLRSGICAYTTEEGLPIAVVHDVNDVPEGDYVLYDYAGRLQETGTLRNGKLVDTRRLYAKDSTVIVAGYQYGLLNGYVSETKGKVLVMDGYYASSHRDSTWTMYDAQGKPARTGKYVRGKPYGEVVMPFAAEEKLLRAPDLRHLDLRLPDFSQAEKLPQYPGGWKAMKEKLRVPVPHDSTSRKQPKPAIVTVDFTIDENGKVTNVHLPYPGSDPKLLEAAALETVRKLPDFIPGERLEHPAKYEMSVWVWFRGKDE